MDWTALSSSTVLVLVLVLLAEASNGWTDAPAGTSAAVASGVLTKRQALWVTAGLNFVGLMAALIFGAAVAQTIGTGIVRPEVISVASIGAAMITTIVWAAFAAWLGLSVSKTHSLLAALAGIGYAQGGIEALLPASANWNDSGWVAAAKGVGYAIILGSASAFVLASIVKRLALDRTFSEKSWRQTQRLTVCLVASGHGFNDGLKYVGIFTLVLYKNGTISEFRVEPMVIVLCAIVMGIGTLLGGWRIHQTLNTMVNGNDPNAKKAFRSYMGVCTEVTAALAIWTSGSVGIPMSTNHAVVSAMAGARSSAGKAHISSIVKIFWGWIITYVFNFWLAEFITTWWMS